MTGRALGARLLPGWAVLAALLFGMLLVRLAGASPVAAYRDLLGGPLADLYGFATMLVRTTPLLFAGLGVAVALRAGLINIGAEGQIYLGGLAATLVGLYAVGLPALLHVALAMLAAAAAGGAWALPPALLRLRRDVSEVITTLLMNYIGLYLVGALVSGPLKEPGAPYPYSPPLARTAWLPVIIPATDAHAGILIALALAAAALVVLNRTTAGFRLRMVGANARAAAYAGVNVRRTVVAAMVASGALAGLGGASEVMGLKHRLFDAFSPGYGYDAVVVAFLGGGRPAAVAVAAVFFGALRSGAGIMQRSQGVPVAMIFAIQGLAVLALAASLAVRHRLFRWGGPDGSRAASAIRPGVRELEQH